MPELADSELVPKAIAKLRGTFTQNLTRSYAWRMEQLVSLRKMIINHTDEFVSAVQKDLGKKVSFEVIQSEINIPIGEIEEMIANLKEWMAPEPISTNMAAIPAHSFIHKDPLGVVLIISPWNYPFNLAIIPLMGALAAGNTVFLKASRHSQHTGAALQKLIPRYLDNNAVVVESMGGAEMITQLLQHKWDHIFFTGSVDVGKIVYEAAAKHLTPVTLELGGKNPAIVDRNVDVHFAAKRIVWGKFWNCGQTCITSDYVLVHKDVEKEFIDAVKKVLLDFYGENPQRSDSYARIISVRQLKRLEELVKSAGDVAVGGVFDEKDKYAAPTILTNVKLDSQLMNEEIFGPILPIIPFQTIDEAIHFCNARPHPLALYLFSRDVALQDKVLAQTHSGAASVNDILVHFSNSRLPFGGVGHSGVGAYHGRLSFDTFSHRRAVLRAPSNAIFDLPIRYPPYTPTKQFLASKLTTAKFEQNARFSGKLFLILAALRVATIVFTKISSL